MRVTKNKIKDLIQILINDKKELHPAFLKAHRSPILYEEEDLLTIAKHNFLGGQIYAYNKILQIMNFKKGDTPIE